MNNLAQDSMNTQTNTNRLDFNTPALQRMRQRRALKDRIAHWYFTVGGMSVLVAITLIFFYLAQVVMPMFQGAGLENRHTLKPSWMTELKGSQPLVMAIEEQNQIVMRLGQDAQMRFFELETGNLVSSLALPIPEGVSITAVGEDVPGSRQLALGLSDGQVLLVQHDYLVSYPNNKKTITPRLVYPLGEQPIRLAPEGVALEHVGLSHYRSDLFLAGSVDKTLYGLKLSRSENMLTGESTLEEERVALPELTEPVKTLIVDPRHMWLYVVGRQYAEVFDLRRKELNGHYKLVESGTEVSTVSALLGGISLMVGDTKGGIAQWFMTRDPEGRASLTQIRDFKLADQPVIQIIPEERRKGFLGLDAAGNLGIFHSTAHRTLLIEDLGEGLFKGALSPRADQLALEGTGGLKVFEVDNHHPEVSWSALWGKVWYESYDEPDYIWQSTSANSDFEPKLSLAPLAFGTLKAAFYAMLLAAPLAICAAVYTAYFMAPAMRRKVKPVIELMEALPTVILGFFAGLFLAPYVENHLPGIFSLLLLMPVGIVGAAWGWSRLPESIRLRIPDGWEGALLIPVVLLVGSFSLLISGHLEAWFFGGDMRQWLTNDMGIPFDQRNALVVGLAMGFAVIPNIYSIAEDAIFSVPKSLTLGSLALGATPWQTLTRVVILTASPGIFSALMIGMGRAVGETMIVLMATGNTPIMDVNIFEGLRTLAANVAVEMPESEVGGTHYRVLFLAALVLLSFTFVMNTLAELIRQRLRGKYASL